MSRLTKENSPYLRHAADQKIDWYPWSDEAFERARREEKPLFLSSGAVWCHWCHVMAGESFADEEIAALLNERFIAIKLDRDERPDIDRRYQQAVSAMGAGGGWPLSVFLTPDRKAFFGGTYFPPEDRQGRPGFKNVLRAVSDFYRLKQDDADEYARKVMDTLRPEKQEPGTITVASLNEAVQDILSLADTRNGGFGTQPKFPMPGAMEFLIRRHDSSNGASPASAVRSTLYAMARGGFHDQLAGGFHRYSVDEAWLVPHFEKMADDNAWLLRNYVDAYGVFGDERFREVARGIITFMREVLSDPDGGFYASQDADVTPDDEGGYFTWTEEDFRRVLDKQEYEVLSLHFFHERGAMHHDPSKKVLAVFLGPEDIAEKLGKKAAEIAGIVARGKEKLLKERMTRNEPFIDKTLYTSLNGMVISSFLRAFRILGDPGIKKFAFQSLDRILGARWVEGVLAHSDGIAAVLDDYIHIIDALVAAYEVTGEQRYRSQAAELMDACMEQFWDRDEGGFFDTAGEVLGTRLKRIEDIPHPSANATAITVLLRLSHATGRGEYARAAEQALSVFTGAARDMGVHAGSFFSSLDAYFHLLKLTVEASPDSELAKAARSLPGPCTAIVYGEDKGRVIPCIRDRCYEPVTEPKSLIDFAAGVASGVVSP